MDKTKENQNASKNEIKIEMTFGTALAITQQTYNYFKLIKEKKDRKNFANKLNLNLKKYIKLNQCIDKTNKEYYEKRFQECNQSIIKKFEDFNQSVIEKIKELKTTNQDTHAKFVELKKIIDQSTSGKFEELKTTIYQDIKSFDEVEKQISQLQKRKIKIENDIQQTENDDIRNLNNKEIGNFKLYSITYDEKSNFSGITYINEREDAIDVAIACRGTDLKERKDLWQDVTMLWEPDTDSDNSAKDYAINILTQIQKQYSDKQINVITLGHSKGGREAQKQMLRLLDEKKLDEKEKKLHINNIYCLTFNSAPCSKEDNKVKVGNCQNLITYDNLTLSADPLSYKDWLIPITILFLLNIAVMLYIFSTYEIISLIVFILIKTCILNLLKQRMGMTSGQIILIMMFSISAATLITLINIYCNIVFFEKIILLIIIALLLTLFRILMPKIPFIKLGKNCGNDCGYFVKSIDTLFNAHNLNSFWHEKSYYEDLKNMNVTDIIKLEKKENLITLAEAERKKRGASANQTNVQKIN